MDTLELPAGIQHGTPEGFAAGCHKDTRCPALHTHGMACVYAHVRSTTDVRYYKAKVRDPRPEAIARALGIRAPQAAQIEKLTDTDEHFAERPPSYRFKERKPRATTPTPEETTMPTPTPAEIAGKPSTTDIRKWARAHGMRVNDYGFIPRDVRIAYDEAHAAPAEPSTAAAANFETFEKPAPLTTDKWTAGLTQKAKTAKLAEIRDWARQNGFPGVPTHGKIPQDALAAYDAAQSTVVVGALNPRPVPGGIIPALLRKEAEASIALDKGDHDGQTFTLDDVDETAEVTKDAIAEIFDIPAELLDGPPGPTATELAGERARAWSERMAELEETFNEHPADVSTPLEPGEFVEALDQARERIGDIVSAGAGPVIVDVPAGERPDWGGIAISVDVERARDLAVRLEGELARTEAALATTITRWWTQVEENNELRRNITEIIDTFAIALAAEREANRILRNSNYALAQLRRQVNRKKGRR